MDSGEEEYLHSKLRNKGKSQTYLIRPNVLELKERTGRQGKCWGAAVLQVPAANQQLRMESSPVPKDYAHISNDIWYHLSNHIRPEDVQRYALICKQSEATTKTRKFWLQLYRKYCQHSNNRNRWILELPAHLQMIELTQCDIKSLRHRVIQALFYCHTPFRQWCKSYTLQKLAGRYYVSSWHLKHSESVWIMCYKFGMSIVAKDNHNDCNNTAPLTPSTSEEQEVAQDWEALLEQSNEESCRSRKSESTLSTSFLHDHNEGVILLQIFCNRFIPFPSEFLASTSSIRLASTRKLISRDMRLINLHIDLVSLTGNQSVTWKYNQVLHCKVLPWWHPDFNQFNKCEF